MCEWAFISRESARDAGAGAAVRLWETQAGDSASGKATNTRGGCSWRTSSRGRREECRMCSREEDERLVDVEGGAYGSTGKRTNTLRLPRVVIRYSDPTIENSNDERVPTSPRQSPASSPPASRPRMTIQPRTCPDPLLFSLPPWLPKSFHH
jgi:hypothetical protein